MRKTRNTGETRVKPGARLAHWREESVADWEGFWIDWTTDGSARLKKALAISESFEKGDLGSSPDPNWPQVQACHVLQV